VVYIPVAHPALDEARDFSSHPDDQREIGNLATEDLVPSALLPALVDHEPGIRGFLAKDSGLQGDDCVCVRGANTFQREPQMVQVGGWVPTGDQALQGQINPSGQADGVRAQPGLLEQGQGGRVGGRDHALHIVGQPWHVGAQGAAQPVDGLHAVVVVGHQGREGGAVGLGLGLVAGEDGRAKAVVGVAKDSYKTVFDQVNQGVSVGASCRISSGIGAAGL